MYPPVDTDFYHPDRRRARAAFALVVSALVPYKRIDLAIDACRLAGVPLKIVGDGPERGARSSAHGRRRRRVPRPADPTTTIRDAVSARGRVVLLPGEEDFGIVPVEAQACGRPVVALGRGGALETVVRRRDRRARRRADRPRRSPTRSRGVAGHALRPRRDPRARRAVRPRALRRRDRRRVDRRRARRTGRHAMVRRYNRLLVAFYVVTDALLGMAAFIARLRRSGSRRGLIPITKGMPPLEQYLNVLPFIARARAARRSSCRGSTGCAAAARASTISSPSSSAASSRSSSASSRTLYVQTYFATDAAQGPRRVRGLAARSGRSSSSSTSRSPTRRASWCAKCSSAAGAPASA